jgi:hypothetical protein
MFSQQMDVAVDPCGDQAFVVEPDGIDRQPIVETRKRQTLIEPPQSVDAIRVPSGETDP